MVVATLVEQLLVSHLLLPAKTCTGKRVITTKVNLLLPICLGPVVLHHIPVLEVLHVIVVVLVEDSKLSLLFLCLSSQLFGQHRLEHHLTNCVISGKGVLEKEVIRTTLRQYP